MVIFARLSLILSLLLIFSFSFGEEKTFLGKTLCAHYERNGYGSPCQYDAKEEDYYTVLNRKGKAYETARQEAYDRGVANGTIDPNADIIVTAPKFDPVSGVPYLDGDAPNDNGISRSLTVPVTNGSNLSGTEDDIQVVRPAQETNNLTVGASNGGPTFQDITSSYDTQCKPQLESTQQCCQHPERCLGSGGTQNSAILGSLQAVLASAGQAASLSGACGQMQNVALTTSAINTALAAQCMSQISQCKSSCSQLIEQARTMYSECRRSGATCTSAERAELSRISAAGNSCEANESYAQQQANQTVASALTAKTMGLCKDATSSNTQASSSSAGVRSFSLNCADSANAANPACQTACNRAGAQNDPLCNPSLAAGGFGSSSGSLVDPNGKNQAGAESGLDEIEANQAALTDTVSPTGSKIATGSSSGGSANIGDGGDNSGGLTTRDYGTSLDSLDFDSKNVNGGVRTGNGYSSSSQRSIASKSNDGGLFGLPFFGQKDGGLGKPFNPKDFLPGGRLDPRRKLAGLGATTGIGSAHGDIFKSITNRFYQVCLRDGLMDCEILRKNSHLGK